jgi:uncharacterized protein with FMN-binding domain
MRRIAMWVAGTVVVLVLAFGYRTSLSGPRTSTVAGGAAQHPGLVANPAPSAGGSEVPNGTATGGVIVNGDIAQTMWGPVQVQVHIRSGRITDVVTLVHPSGTGRDEAINSYALPVLRREALAAQSSKIQAVSGATVTSGGYVESLQAALDAAHFPG